MTVALGDVGRTILTRRGLQKLPPAVRNFIVLPSMLAWVWIVLGHVWMTFNGVTGAHAVEPSPTLLFLDATICRGGRIVDTASGHVTALKPGEWAVMIVAMMWPTLIPPATYLSQRSFRDVQYRTVGLFILAYSLIWMIAYPVARMGLTTIESALIKVNALVWAGALGASLAALWQLMPLKNRMLRACHRVPVMGTKGCEADRVILRFGLDHGLRCAGSCFLLMTFPMLNGHGLIVMVVVSILMLAERAAPRPDLKGSALILFGLAVWQILAMMIP